jgi:hypothetical protein
MSSTVVAAMPRSVKQPSAASSIDARRAGVPALTDVPLPAIAES